MANGVTTEWEDLHVKLGNYEERPKETPQSELTKQAIDKIEQHDPLASKNLEELKDLEDDFEDDFLASYMNKRKKELEELSKKPHFGGIQDITKEDYVREVTNAPENVTVLLHLYLTYNENSLKINELLAILSKKYPLIKFLRSVATKCVENFPEERVPTFIVYRNGKLVDNLINVDRKIKPLTVDGLEKYLKLINVIPLEEGEEREEIEENYGRFMLKKNINTNKDRDYSDSDEDDREYMSNRFKKY